MSDFLSGVTIKVNGSQATITSATRQSNHAVVHYALDTPVVAGDTVTWEYAAASGHIVAEAGGEPLGDVSAQTVTNNVSGGDPIGDALRADAVAYWKMDEESGTRLDSKGAHNLTEVYANDFSAATGLVSSVAGKIGLAEITVDDPDSPIVLYNGSFGLTTTFLTIAGWFKTGIWSSDFYGLQSSDVSILATTIPSTVLLAIETLEDGTYVVRTVYHLDPHVVVTPSEWHFVTMECNGHTRSIQVDAGSPITVDVSDDWSSGITFADIQVGFPNYNDNTDTLSVDELGIWIRALTTDERAYLYNSGAGRALFPAP